MSEQKTDVDVSLNGDHPRPQNLQAWAVMALYAGLAFLPTFILDLRNVQVELGELTGKGWLLLVLPSVYQGGVAVKAYLSTGWRKKGADETH